MIVMGILWLMLTPEQQKVLDPSIYSNIYALISLILGLIVVVVMYYFIICTVTDPSSYQSTKELTEEEIFQKAIELLNKTVDKTKQS